MILGIIWAIALWAIVTIIIEYVDWDRIWWDSKKKNKSKEKKQSKINWSVVWTILFIICIALLASLTK